VAKARSWKQKREGIESEIYQMLFSFLPMKDVVIAYLSKRWKNLWMSVPNLDFEEEGIFGDRVHFMNFVERVMMLCNFSDIRNFSPHVMCTLMHLTLIHGYLLHCVANFKN